MRIVEVEGEFYKIRSKEELQNERYKSNFNKCMKQIVENKEVSRTLIHFEKKLDNEISNIGVIRNNVHCLENGIERLTQRQHEYDILVDKLIAKRDEKINELNEKIIELENVTTRLLIKMMIKNDIKIKFSDLLDF